MKKAFTVLVMFVAMFATQPVWAQSQPPLLSLLDYLKVDQGKVLQAAPHFPLQENLSEKFETRLEQWLEKFPKEWIAFRQLVETQNPGIGWSTYGISQKYIPENKTVNSSWWQWYQAAKITDEVKQQRFPHFPSLQTNLVGDTLGLNFDRKVANWERLYPKEYIAFLNTPQLKALSASAASKININYTPRFLGVEISETAPKLQNTGDKLSDQYNYDLKYRNWLFVFKPATFDKLYGSDYDYPEGFNRVDYCKNMKTMIERKKNADWGTIKQGK